MKTKNNRATKQNKLTNNITKKCRRFQKELNVCCENSTHKFKRFEEEFEKKTVVNLENKSKFIIFGRVANLSSVIWMELSNTKKK